MEVTLAAAIFVAAASIVGASIQGSIGFGMNLVMVPVLALAIPDSLPATAVLLGIPMSLVMVRHEHHAIDRPGLAWILAGRVPGTLIGTLIVATVSADALKGFIGVTVLLAVGASVVTPPIRLTPRREFAGGLASGTTGTAAGIGGPPLALLYQHHPGPTMRATLAASFLFGTCFSIISLAVAGEVTASDVALACALIPLIVAGAWIGRRAHAWLDRAWLRPAVLVFAAISGVIVLLDAIR